MKYCKRCHSYMIESFEGYPHCQTDKYIIIVEKYGDTEEIKKNE